MQTLEKVKGLDREGLDDEYSLNMDIFEQHLELFIKGFPYRR